ncbi:SET domain containing protein [Trichomonas vaginalis G3]|uniref:SET domain containing protein n=1 Tax=Trichomonas vaginalis (strain ATCC PRA-98 / G3) TaxID=412133 RepID=A2F5J1_TRIV3|nr:histone-lysine N-methyltransferase protein [Trichomonas vaginalis G3]EAX99817.1 SET domain containing protein [Trichomonas vaginalis G3]KAI5517816.1 histone-lysine N-methyltransferase protein [Trichomonas vaginalis G3]|eukprot:XP_001312747.1 SET domain containing protein [Trichomonas vaginalis G3]
MSRGSNSGVPAKLNDPIIPGNVSKALDKNSKLVCSRLEKIEFLDQEERANAISHTKRNVVSITSNNHEMSVFANVGRFRFEKSTIHGFGLFTTEKLRAQENLIDITCPVVRTSVAEMRYQKYKKINPNISFIIQIDENNYVDLTNIRTPARYLNHSCESNCQLKLASSKSSATVSIVAKRDILPYEELTLDYGISSIPRTEKIPCNCGNPKCRNFINWREAPDDRYRNIQFMHIQILAGNGIINPITKSIIKQEIKQQAKLAKEEKQKKKEEKMSKEERLAKKSPKKLEKAFSKAVAEEKLNKKHKEEKPEEKIQEEKKIVFNEKIIEEKSSKKKTKPKVKISTEPRTTNVLIPPPISEIMPFARVKSNPIPPLPAPVKYDFSVDQKYVFDPQNKHISLKPPLLSNDIQMPDRNLIDNFVRTIPTYE